MSIPRYGLLDRYLNRSNGLPKGSAYSITDHEVVASDGTVLRAALYAPAGAARGTIVAMTPYGRIGFAARFVYGIYAAQGYNLLAVSVRGTFGSGERFDPMFGDGSDFRDVVAWMRGQAWYTGTFATLGASYLGWTQWALLSEEAHPDHRAAIVLVGPHDFREFHWNAGTFTSALQIWAATLTVQGRASLRSLMQTAGGGKGIYKRLRRAPVAETLYELAPDHKDWLRERIAHEPDDPYWEPLDLSATLDRVSIPVLISAGWQDTFLKQSLEQFRRLRARGVDAAFTVGPWAHAAASGGKKQSLEAFEWLEAHLSGAGPGRQSRVHLHVTGADEWRDLDVWPPATVMRRLHVDADALSERPASGEASFPFDPEDPPTFPGGPLLFGGGYAADTAVAQRDDVFAVASATLTDDLEVHGAAMVVLDHRAEHPHSDVFVRLSDIDEKGRSQNVAQGMLRVRENGTVRIELTPIAHRFRAGHRIRIAIAGGAYPHFPASPGTGENPMLAKKRIPNRHTIALPGSHIELPVV